MFATLQEISDQVPGQLEKGEDSSLLVPEESKPAADAEPVSGSPTTDELASDVSQERVGSGESFLSGSVASQSSIRIRTEGSENGTETEEDEGMVLVGRPL